MAAALCAVGPVLAQSPTTTATTNPAAPTGTSTRVVQVTSLTGPIHAGATRLVGRAIESAERRGAEAVVLVLDTWGGYERATQDVVLRLQQAAVPVVIYVGPSGAQARAAGLFIGQAGDLLTMAPGTSIGGAPLGDDPPPGTAAGLDGAAVYARNLAQQRGRNASWTEQAVRDGDSLPATEALRIRVVDEVASDLQDLLLKLDGRTVDGPWGTRQLATRGASLETVDATPVQSLLSYLIDPNVAYLLLVIGLYGI
ncbi:MAG TPA: hypothetical protein VHN78_01455, partial [Chloroflexota bacterium]|nr:hypothetical protein [Chloroflexota bacterium]